MKLTTLSFIFLLYTLGNIIDAVPTQNNNTAETAASLQIVKWEKQYQQYIHEIIKTRKSGCTSDNIIYRQEWGSLSKQSRIDYTNAVQCLQRKAPVSPLSKVPGARSRFDDFSATHIIASPYVHFSGLFFHFHRYFLHLYETALRDECNYTGTQPYWDWTLSYQDPRLSTVFDGSPTSLGSNGLTPLIGPHPTNITAFGITLTLPPGTGGGCIHSGPFSNYTVNLGPVAFHPSGPEGGLGYNPRCLTRDISLEWSNNDTKPSDVVSLIEGGKECGDVDDFGCFGTTMEAIPGVHAGGHFAIGGLASDAYASAGDPAFYLHHAQVDRVWTLWQNINKPRKRTRQVYGTGTAVNFPPSPNVTLNTEIDFSFNASPQRVGNLVSTIDGPFCYMYI